MSEKETVKARAKEVLKKRITAVLQETIEYVEHETNPTPIDKDLEGLDLDGLLLIIEAVAGDEVKLAIECIKDHHSDE